MGRFRDFRVFRGEFGVFCVFSEIKLKEAKFGNLKILNENIDYNNGLREKNLKEV